MRTLFLTLLLWPALPAQSSEQAIRAVLDRQVADWNRGDVRAFMEGYDNSDATLFVGSSVIRGHQRVPQGLRPAKLPENTLQLRENCRGAERRGREGSG